VSRITSMGELENVKAMIIPVMNTSSQRLRQQAARTFASALLSIRGDELARENLGDSVNERRKNLNQPDSVEPQPDNRSLSIQDKPSSVGPITFTLGLRDILRYISSVYTRSNSRYVRSALIQTYACLFVAAGSDFVAANYDIVLDHLLDDLVVGSPSTDNRYRCLLRRKHVSYLLNQVVRQRLLDEPAKMSALKSIFVYLEKRAEKCLAVDIHADIGQIEPLIIATNELSGMLRDLGTIVSSIQV